MLLMDVLWLAVAVVVPSVPELCGGLTPMRSVRLLHTDGIVTAVLPLNCRRRPAAAGRYATACHARARRGGATGDAGGVGQGVSVCA